MFHMEIITFDFYFDFLGSTAAIAGGAAAGGVGIIFVVAVSTGGCVIFYRYRKNKKNKKNSGIWLCMDYVWTTSVEL